MPTNLITVITVIAEVSLMCTIQYWGSSWIPVRSCHTLCQTHVKSFNSAPCLLSVYCQSFSGSRFKIVHSECSGGGQERQVYTFSLHLWPKVSLLHNDFLFLPAGLKYTHKHMLCFSEYMNWVWSCMLMAVASKTLFNRKP